MGVGLAGVAASGWAAPEAESTAGDCEGRVEDAGGLTLADGFGGGRSLEDFGASLARAIGTTLAWAFGTTLASEFGAGLRAACPAMLAAAVGTTLRAAGALGA